MARPREIDREKLLANFEQYIESTDIPIVAEFAYQAGLHREQLYEIDELSYALKRCISKKEAMLEKQALAGTVNCTMAIFSLKQLGWKDRTSTELTGKDDGPIQYQDTSRERNIQSIEQLSARLAGATLGAAPAATTDSADSEPVPGTTA